MHIKDHSAAMKFFRTYDNVASKGKWKEFVDEMEFESMLQEPRTTAQEPRIGLLEAGLVTRGENANKWRVNNFYSKTKEGKFQPPKGKSSDAFFNSEKKALAAIEKRKKESSRGLSLEELNKKYKKQLKTYGVSSWDKADKLTKQKIKSAYLNEKFPRESVAKWKKEGLTTGLNEKTRNLLATEKPIKPATGLPYTLKEFTALTKGQKNILIRRLEGKEPTRPWAVRRGWYPEKKLNKLMTYLKLAAEKQKNLPLKERNFIPVWEGEKFVGVKDVRKNTLWTHIDYDLTGKEGKIITKHPSHKNIQYFFKQAEKFKLESPDKLLGSYFTKYESVPKYSEMYRFFTVSPETVGAKTGIAYKINPLQQHHQELMAKEPARSIQLALPKQNTEASRILNQFEKGNYSLIEANKRLNEIGVRIKGSKGWMGPAAGEITTAKSLEAAQAETIKMFKDAYKNNPKIVNQMTKALNIAKKAKGPGRLKVIQYLITLGIPVGAVATLGFSPTEVQAAEAEAAEPGAAADMSKWLFESGLTFGEKAKVIGAAAIGDWAVNKSKLSKAFLKGLPFLWTPGGNVAWEAYSHFSKTEPKLEDFAEGFKAGGYDINSEEFKSQWDSIPEQEREKMLYNWSGMVLDQRSTGEKIKETAASPWTHAEYAFWKHGVESMQNLLKANPGNSALTNKLKQAALVGIRMGIPMRVIAALNPIGWTLTGATVVNAIREGTTQEDWRPEPLTHPEWGGHEPVESAQTVTNLLRGYQEKHVPEDQRDKFTIDYSLPEKFAGGGPVRLTRTVAPDSEGIMSLKKKR